MSGRNSPVVQHLNYGPSRALEHPTYIASAVEAIAGVALTSDRGPAGFPRREHSLNHGEAEHVVAEEWDSKHSQDVNPVRLSPSPYNFSHPAYRQHPAKHIYNQDPHSSISSMAPTPTPSSPISDPRPYIDYTRNTPTPSQQHSSQGPPSPPVSPRCQPYSHIPSHVNDRIVTSAPASPMFVAYNAKKSYSTNESHRSIDSVTSDVKHPVRAHTTNNPVVVENFSRPRVLGTSSYEARYRSPTQYQPEPGRRDFSGSSWRPQSSESTSYSNHHDHTFPAVSAHNRDSPRGRVQHPPPTSFRPPRPYIRAESTGPTYTRDPIPRMASLPNDELRLSGRSQPFAPPFHPPFHGTFTAAERCSIITKRSLASIYGNVDDNFSIDDVLGLYGKGFDDDSAAEDNDSYDSPPPTANSEPSKEEGEDMDGVSGVALAISESPSQLSDDHPAIRDSTILYYSDEAPTSPESTENFELSEVAEESKIAENTANIETPEITEGTMTTDNTENTEKTEHPELTQKPDITEPTDNTEHAEITENTDNTANTEHTENAEMDEVAEEAMVQRESVMSEASRLHSSADFSPSPPMRRDTNMTTTGEEERDRYGFKKSNQYITLEEYDRWESQYSKYLARRRKKWVLFLKENGLMTDNPNRFPPRSTKAKRFVRKGIPPEWRGAAWFYYAGGPAIVAKHAGLYNELLGAEVKEVDAEAIERDLHRTFPDNIKFRTLGGPGMATHGTASTRSSRQTAVGSENGGTPGESSMISSLRRVLLAFSVYNPRIGYCQSLNFLAGLLLLFVESEEQAFWLLNIITRVYLPGTHEMSLEGANVDLGVLMSSIRDTMPNVWAKIGGELDGTDAVRPKSRRLRHRSELSGRLPPITLCMTAWFMSCFIGTLPIESTLRVWDVFFYEGSKTLFRIALTIFKLGESEIKTVGDPMEIFQVVQTIPRRMIDANALMEACYKRRNGFGHLSQETIELKRQERRKHVQAERERLAAGEPILLPDAEVRKKGTLFTRKH